MKISMRSQTILISGVSGAGKTVSAKRILDYLMGPNEHDDCKVHDGNLILEMFAHAQTENNDNSSRFCKYLELRYDSNFDLVSVSAHCHLLEINRVCHINAGETNFHVFYAMLQGSSDLRDQLMLSGVETFHVCSSR